MQVKTLIQINPQSLNDYQEWDVANKGKWNIASYLNQNYDINAALAFSKLFFPDFLEVKGAIILSFRYDASAFNQWYEEFQGEISKVERYSNLYDVGDYFHINRLVYASEELFQLAVGRLARCLKVSWETNCKLLFPDRKVVCDVFEEYETTRITLYSISQ